MRFKKLLPAFLGILFVFFVSVFIWKNLIHKEKIQKRTRFLMDTYCTIQVPGGAEVISIIDRAFDRMEQVDRKFNVLNPESPLYGFNKRDISVTDEEIVNLIHTALRISKESNGAFDITVYPLLKLWGFYDDSPALPKKENINKCIKKIGYKNLLIKNEKIMKLKGDIEIDLGGIAKGYAISEAVKVLKKEGIKSALIDAGGDIYALGKLWDNLWKVGIRNPRGDGIIGILEVSDLAVVTSGDYERFFEKDGIKYHHILDPGTGYPAKGLASVTVVSSDPVLADAWSTALFVMGKEEGLKLVEKTKEAEVLMVTPEGEILCSAGLKEVLEIIKKGVKK